LPALFHFISQLLKQASPLDFIPDNFLTVSDPIEQNSANLGKSNVEYPTLLRQNTGMATLSLTDEQVLQLVKQLPPQSKQRVLTDLTAERDQWWQTAAREGKQDMRRLAVARGLNWDSMSEAERESFVDELLHES